MKPVLVAKRENGDDEIRASLARVLGSTEFQRSDRVRQLLAFLVETTLSGGGAILKESVIAVRVFDRDPSYDPKIDPVVRVAVGRLRAKLDLYYAKEGRADTLRIEIDKGTYVPAFRTVATPLPQVVSPLQDRATGRKRLVWTAVATVFAFALALGTFTATRPRPPSLQGVRVLFSSGGQPLHPSISPAGDMLAFDWAGPEDVHSAIYLQRMDGTSPVRLTPGKQVETWPVWSPDGRQVAFLREIAADRVAVISVPVVGVGERVWLEVEKSPGERPRLDWSPDGKTFATAERKQPAGSNLRPLASSILLYSLETGQRRTLTRPPPDWRGDSEPVFSPNSTEIAFRRTRPQSGDENIFTVPATGGEPRQVTFDRAAIAALTYTPDHGLLFSSRRGGWLRNLWWVAPRGTAPILVSSPAFDLGSPTVSRDGRHLAYIKVLYDSNIWRLPAGGGEPVAVAPSEFAEVSPAFSPDGRQIVFVSSRSGALEVWVSGVSGANAVRLTDSGGDQVSTPSWSPDGRWIAYEWRAKGREGIYIIPSSGGRPRPLVTGSSRDAVPRWSRDGRFVYFNSNRTGSQQIWRIPAEGGQAIAITSEGGSAATQSQDGAFLYCGRPGVNGIWGVPLKDGVPAGAQFQVLADVAPEDWGNWAVGAHGFYFIRRASASRRNTLEYFDLATRASRTVHTLKAPPLWNAVGLAVAPGEETVLFVQVDSDGTSVYGR